MSETDPVKYFESEIKRLNYYNSQFLVADDFLDEQYYHTQMRRFHNRSLHTWGIVEGLEVKQVTGANKVTVAPGIAIDRLGQEIVWPNESDAVALDAFDANSQVYVTIKYDEDSDQADKDTQSTNDYRRKTERPKVGASATAPAADAADVVLAIITLDKDKAIAQVDRSVRRYAGSRIGSSDDGKEFSIYADTAGAWHFFDGGKAADRLTIDARGNVGIGTLSPYTQLQISKDATGALGPVLTLMNTGRGAGSGAAIDLSSYDPGPGIAPSSRLQIIDDGNYSSHFSFQTKNRGSNNNDLAERMRISSEGNVGIGTTTPGFPLTFADALGDKISLWGQSGNHYGFGIQSALLQIHTDLAASDIAFGYGSSGSFTETMRIKGNGNVGIGRNPGGAKLDVNGAVWTQILQITDGNGAVYPDNWIGMANNIDGATKWLHIGGITDSGERRLALMASRVHANGNLGIGTTAPISQLHIKKDAVSALGPVLTLMNAGGSSGAGGAIDFDGYDPQGQDPSARIQSLDDGKFSSHLVFLSKEPTANTNKLKERVRISSAGNVGIGTNDPGNSKLRIASGTDFANFRFDSAGAGELLFVAWTNGWNIDTMTSGKHLYINRDSNDNSDVFIGHVGRELTVKGNTGNVGVGNGVTGPSVKLAVGGNGANVYATDIWVENNMHVQGNETLTQGGRGRLRVGTAWSYIGLYAENSSTGAANDLVLGASSGVVRVGPSNGPQNFMMGADYAAGGAMNYRIVCGTIRGDGAILSGAGFTVSKVDRGLYQINFNPIFTMRPAASVTQIYPDADNFGVGGNTRDNAVITGLNNTAIKIKTGDGDGDWSDRSFTFVVVGPR